MTLIKILFVTVICTPIFALGYYLLNKIVDQLDRK